MTGWVNSMIRDIRAAAAAELALSLPLMLILLFGSTEAGFFFYNEHKLVEGVRDATRFAGRQSFSDYPCDGSTTQPPQAIIDDITEILRYGQVGGSVERIPRMAEATINVTYVCTSQMETVGGSGSYVPVEGIYENAGSAPIVTVDASVPYQSLFGFVYGFPGPSITLNADQQATVNGI